jgi:hypothetical protein
MHKVSAIQIVMVSVHPDTSLSSNQSRTWIEIVIWLAAAIINAADT